MLKRDNDIVRIDRLKYLRMLSLLPIVIVTAFSVSCDLTERQYFESVALDYAEEQSEDVVIYEIVGEFIEREIRASRIERYYDDKKIEATTVHIIDYNPDKSIKMTLDADHLSIDEVRNIYTALDNVVINHENAILLTDKMIWNQNTDEIFAPDDVTIIRGENILQGFELRTDIEFSSLELSRVTAEGKLDDEELSDFDW